MKIKTCSAENLPELMKQMRTAFGADAILLSTRRVENASGEIAIEGTVGIGAEFASAKRPNPVPTRRFEPAPLKKVEAPVRGLAFDIARAMNGCVLVGPAGSGKTTTAGKLASKAKALRGGVVGVISTDTQRAGGSALLLALADSLDVNSTTADSAATLRTRMSQWGNRGVLVVDTASANIRDHKALGRLSETLNAAGESMMRVLVLSANESDKVVKAWLQLYEKLELDGVIITCVDQDLNDGAVLAEVRQQGRPAAQVGSNGELLCGRDRVAQSLPMELATYS